MPKFDTGVAQATPKASASNTHSHREALCPQPEANIEFSHTFAFSCLILSCPARDRRGEPGRFMVGTGLCLPFPLAYELSSLPLPTCKTIWEGTREHQVQHQQSGVGGKEMLIWVDIFHPGSALPCPASAQQTCPGASAALAW